MRERHLIINADDYGLCAEVNDAVAALHAAGVLGGVSLLANGVALADAVSYLHQHPTLSAGVHLNVVEGRPLATAVDIELLTDDDGQFLKLRRLLPRWLQRPRAVTRAVELEWRAQLEYLLAAGVQLHHLDSHQHLHAFPMAFGCAVKLAREFGIRGLRLPNERLQDRLRLGGAAGLRSSLALAQAFTSPAGLRCNDHFLGFRHAGHYTLPALLADIGALPDGLTELAVHPSQRDHVPYAAYHSRRERDALLDTAFRARVAELGIKLMTWAEV